MTDQSVGGGQRLGQYMVFLKYLLRLLVLGFDIVDHPLTNLGPGQVLLDLGKLDLQAFGLLLEQRLIRLGPVGFEMFNQPVIVLKDRLTLFSPRLELVAVTKDRVPVTLVLFHPLGTRFDFGL